MNYIGIAGQITYPPPSMFTPFSRTWKYGKMDFADIKVLGFEVERLFYNTLVGPNSP